jgi:hypothetical protein
MEPCQLPIGPEYYIPPSYLVGSLSPAQKKISSFSEETLFYIFYAMPQDVLQDAAAQELYARNWRYHKEMRVWLTKDPASHDTIQKTATHEHGRYILFDPNSWSRVTKELTIAYESLEERTLTQGRSSGLGFGGVTPNVAQNVPVNAMAGLGPLGAAATGLIGSGSGTPGVGTPGIGSVLPTPNSVNAASLMGLGGVGVPAGRTALSSASSGSSPYVGGGGSGGGSGL